MPWGVAAAAVGTVVAGSMAADAQADAAETAANAQKDSAALGIKEQRRQFDALQELLKPYADYGSKAIGAQGDLLGLNGTDAQQKAIASLQSSPQFTSLLKQGENSILANASATGGLRGGNTERALMEFSPQLLSQVINDQYSKLGGLTSVGQNAAAMTGNAGMNSANQVSALLQQQGAATAGAALAQGKAEANMWGSVGQAFSMLGGAYSGGFGGGASSASTPSWGSGANWSMNNGGYGGLH